MPARLTFLAISAFWLTMNVLLWRAEYGSHGEETPVPLNLVWQKILTAPDASSLTVFQKGERMGYCEVSTGIGREMAAVDADRPPPEGIVRQAGYGIHLAGNVALGDFTNRIKFDGRIEFVRPGEWRELNLKIFSRDLLVEIRSLAANRSAHVRILADGAVLERDVSFADLQDPVALIRALAGNAADPLLDAVELPDFAAAAAQRPEWRAVRTRVRIGSEAVPIYRLETGALGQSVTVDVSPAGEVLRVRLPGGYVARIDEWTGP